VGVVGAGVASADMRCPQGPSGGDVIVDARDACYLLIYFRHGPNCRDVSSATNQEGDTLQDSCSASERLPDPYIGADKVGGVL
jgi:hypothetical protein